MTTTANQPRQIKYGYRVQSIQGLRIQRSSASTLIRAIYVEWQLSCYGGEGPCIDRHIDSFLSSSVSEVSKCHSARDEAVVCRHLAPQVCSSQLVWADCGWLYSTHNALLHH